MYPPMHACMTDVGPQTVCGIELGWQRLYGTLDLSWPRAAARGWRSDKMSEASLSEGAPSAMGLRAQKVIWWHQLEEGPKPEGGGDIGDCLGPPVGLRRPCRDLQIDHTKPGIYHCKILTRFGVLAKNYNR